MRIRVWGCELASANWFIVSATNSYVVHEGENEHMKYSQKPFMMYDLTIYVYRKQLCKPNIGIIKKPR